MPQNINQPSNQIKLTNVSIVRLNKGKKRFEIACYKNKVLEWRSGAEKDLDDVLQIPSVFLNVSKGQTAPKADLTKAFGPKMSTDEIILEILNKGVLQVGEKERNAKLDMIHKEVIDIVAGKLVDRKTKRVYTAGMIERALEMLSQQGTQEGTGTKDSTSKQTSGPSTPGTPAANDGDTHQTTQAVKERGKSANTWTGVVTTKSAKSQALQAMNALIAHQPIPVMRARMRLRVTCPTSALKQAVRSAPKAAGSEDGEQAKATGTVKDGILAAFETIDSQDVLSEEWEATGFAEPGALKIIQDLLNAETKGKGKVEVLDMAVVNDGE